MPSRYAQTLACVKMVRDMSAVNLSEADFGFLTSDRLWQARDRALARRCIETAVQGSLDIVGFARLRLPLEFVAATIFYYVKPCNYLTACSSVEGLQYARNIVSGVDDYIDPAVLFSMVCELAAGDESRLLGAEHTLIRAGQYIGTQEEAKDE